MLTHYCYTFCTVRVWTACRVLRPAEEYRVPSAARGTTNNGPGAATSAVKRLSSVRHSDKVRPQPAPAAALCPRRYTMPSRAEPSAGFKVQIDRGQRSQVTGVPWPSRSTSCGRRQPVGRWPPGIESCQDRRGGDGVVTRPSRGAREYQGRVKLLSAAVQRFLAALTFSLTEISEVSV